MHIAPSAKDGARSRRRGDGMGGSRLGPLGENMKSTKLFEKTSTTYPTTPARYLLPRRLNTPA